MHLWRVHRLTDWVNFSITKLPWVRGRRAHCIMYMKPRIFATQKMPRTKQTRRKSTGGKAPRKALVTKAACCVHDPVGKRRRDEHELPKTSTPFPPIGVDCRYLDVIGHRIARVLPTIAHSRGETVTVLTADETKRVAPVAAEFVCIAIRRPTDAVINDWDAGATGLTMADKANLCTILSGYAAGSVLVMAAGPCCLATWSDDFVPLFCARCNSARPSSSHACMAHKNCISLCSHCVPAANQQFFNCSSITGTSNTYY